MGNLFELEDLGAKDLKGISGPVRAWAAVRPSPAESRFEAFHASGVTRACRAGSRNSKPLLRRWSRAKSGVGQVVLLSGEAGIGKSRLTAALLERLPPSHIRAFDISARRSTPTAHFYPVIGQIERAAGLARGDTTQTKLDKLDAMLAQTSTAKQCAL